MATSPMALQRPPQPPPQTTGQMGQGPMQGIATMLANRPPQGGPPAGAPQPGAGQPQGVNPQGAVLAMAAGVGKVIDQIARMSDVFQPYADRIKAIMDAGIAEVVKGTPGQESQQPGPDSPAAAGSSVSAAPPAGEAGKSFPG